MTKAEFLKGLAGIRDSIQKTLDGAAKETPEEGPDLEEEEDQLDVICFLDREVDELYCKVVGQR